MLFGHSNYFCSNSRLLSVYIMLPKSCELPTHKLVYFVDIFIPLLISLDFLCPIFSVARWQSAVLLASMPKTRIQKYNELLFQKYYIWLANHASNIFSITNPSLVQFAAQYQFHF